MSDRPIIFSAPMVRALLDGQKTQTRRVLTDKHGAIKIIDSDRKASWVGAHWLEQVMQDGAKPVLRFSPGDRLWVREAHSLHNAHGQHREDGQRWGPWSGLPTQVSPDGSQIAYFREGFDRCDPGRWRPSIHMPRWASRLTLTVTDVRVQRLTEINRGDAMAEGCPHANMADGPDPRAWFRDLWNSLHGADAWGANPWVVALTFTVERRNIDAEGAA